MSTGFRRLEKFDLTLDQYHSMAEQQDFLCAVCGEEPPPSSQVGEVMDGFAVDHDHQTGRIRALLCPNCNTGMGHMKDSPELLEKAARYLRKHQRISLGLKIAA